MIQSKRLPKIRKYTLRVPLMSPDGFTILELIIVIALAGILAALAIPPANDYFNQSRLNGATFALLADLRLARMTAIEKNRPVVFSVDTLAGTYQAFVNDGGGNLVDINLNGIPDSAENWTLDVNELLVTSGQMPRGVSITAATFGGNPEFRFDNRGFPFSKVNILTGGTVTIAGTAGLTRQVNMIPSGHAIIQ